MMRKIFVDAASVDPLLLQLPYASHTIPVEWQTAPGASQSIGTKLGNCGNCPLLGLLLFHCALAVAVAINPNNVNNSNLFILCRETFSLYIFNV